MLRSITQWFAPPLFPGDRDKTRQASVLNILLVTLLLLIPVLVVGNLLGGRVPVLVYLVNSGMFAVCLALRAWMRRGSVVPAGWTLLVLGIVAITTSLAVLGTVRAPTAAMYLLIIITAGLLTGQAGMIAIIILCIGAIAALIVAGNAGMLPTPDLSVGVTQAVSYAAIFAWTGGLMYAAIRSLRSAIETAETELVARTRAEEDLARHLAELEETVRQRTAELSLSNAQIRAEIDERARAEVALRESEQKFALAFKSSPSTIILTRFPDGAILEVNDGFGAMCGFDRGEVIGRTTVELNLWFDAAERNGVVDTLDKSGAIHGQEVRFLRKSGEFFTGLLSAATFQLNDEMCTLSTIQDISVRKGLEDERERLIERYQETLATVKLLSGIIPICMHCKKIRDDKGYWNRLEKFIQEHSSAEFSHGVCPDCLAKYYPDDM